jgi:hypothetical protein
VWAVTRTGEFLRSDDRAVTWPVNLRPRASPCTRCMTWH